MKPILGSDDSEEDGGLFTNRRRGKSKSGEPKTARKTASGAGWAHALRSGSWGRGLLAGLGGLGIGYLVATLFLFPAAAAPDDLIEVPDLHGMSDIDAILRAEDAGFTVGTIDSLLLPSVDAGTVIGQSPLPGQLGTDSTEVRLTVSAGALQLPVPAILGLPLPRALDLLDATGFTAQVDTVESDQQGGTVVSVEPAVGERLAVPATVALEVSEGAPPVEVPRLVGLDEQDAVALLDSLGLTVGDVEEQFRFGLDQGKVVQQEPAPGVTVEHGASIRIVVGRRGGGSQ